MKLKLFKNCKFLCTIERFTWDVKHFLYIYKYKQNVKPAVLLLDHLFFTRYSSSSFCIDIVEIKKIYMYIQYSAAE